MNTRLTAVLVGVAVIAALALTTVQRARTHDAAAASARAALSAATAYSGIATHDESTSVPPATGVVPAMRQSHMVVAYRLDPSLTSGLFMGDHWVTPARYSFAQQGKHFVVQAKMQAMDAIGSDPMDLSGTWSTQDPEMVALSRDRDGVVTIDVRKPGTTTVVASAGGETKTLRVTARQHPDAMEVAIEGVGPVGRR